RPQFGSVPMPWPIALSNEVPFLYPQKQARQKYALTQRLPDSPSMRRGCSVAGYDEGFLVAADVVVVAPSRAAAHSAARDGGGVCVPLVEREHPRHLNGGAPGAIALNDDERLIMEVVAVIASSDAVAGRCAGERVDLAEPALPAELGHAWRLHGV